MGMKVLAALKEHMDALSKDIANCDQLRRENQMEFCCNCDGHGGQQLTEMSQPANDVILHSQQIVQRMNGVNSVNGQMTSQMPPPQQHVQQRRVLPLPQINLNQN